MKKALSVVLIILLGMGLFSTLAWAKGKPDGVGKAPGKPQVSTTETAPIPEGSEEGTANTAKNRGQQKKLEEQIKVRGMNLKFDVPPVIKEGRTLIPVRAVMNGLGAEVTWDAEAKTVTITRDDKVIVINMATGEVTVNGEIVVLDVPAQTISNRTFVPLRFIAQTLGDKVVYDEETGDIDVGDDSETDGTTDENTEETDGTEADEDTDEEPVDSDDSDDTGDDDETTGDEDTSDEENPGDEEDGEEEQTI